MVRKGDRVRIRFGNLTMTNHPIHMHGYDFSVTLTDGGWVPKTAQWPEVSIDVGVGQMRAFEFVADEPGDWAIHCHKSHHTMGPMRHSVPTMIGVDHRGVAEKIIKLIPDYMVMGDNTMNSLDSRAWGDFAQGSVIGKSAFVYWPFFSQGDRPGRFGWSHR